MEYNKTTIYRPGEPLKLIAWVNKDYAILETMNGERCTMHRTEIRPYKA